MYYFFIVYFFCISGLLVFFFPFFFLLFIKAYRFRFFSSSYYLFKSNCHIITIISTIVIVVFINIMLINITVIGVLEKSSWESSKRGIQAAWSTPNHLVKWWISCFRGVYRTLIASEMELFLILIKGFRQLNNVTRSPVLVAGERGGGSIFASAFHYYYYYYHYWFYYYLLYFFIINGTFDQEQFTVLMR